MTKSNISKRKKVEKRLELYHHYKASIDNLEEDLELLRESDGLGAIDYDQVSAGSTNKINNIVENIGLSNIEKEHYVNHLIKRNESKINSIDRALAALKEEEAQVIRDWYFKNRTADYIADSIGVSTSTLYRIKNQALDYMAVSIYGDCENI